MMKKVTLLILLTLCSLSCKNYLDETIVSGISYGYYDTASGIEAGVAAGYTNLRWGHSGENLHPLQELGTDTYQEGQDGGMKPQLNRYESSLNSQFPKLYEFWSNFYTGISRANIVISSLPKLTQGMSEAQKTGRQAEMRFLRGLYYFYLVQTFGDIPIVTTLDFEVKTDYKRAPVSEVYQLILSDFRFAQANLPLTQADYGRATKGAAQHALALAYLTRGSAVNEKRGQQATDLDSAAYYADAVIASNTYQLVPDFKALWDISNQKNSEVIFAVQYSTNQLYNNNAGNKIHLYYTMVYDNKPGMLRDVENGRPWRRVRPTDFSLYDLFDRKNDARFYKTFKTAWLSNNASNIPKWTARDGFVPRPELLGKPKFTVGDTAIWVTMERLPVNINKDSLYASRSYYYIPRDRQTNAEFPQNYKFYDNRRPAASTEDGSRDWIAFRLGETYLIAAEAYGRKGDYNIAVDRLNVIRRRASYKEGELKPREYFQIDGGKATDRLKSTESNMLLTVASLKEKLVGSSFVDFMLDERGRELHGECIRWWDLVRAEKLYERVKKYNPEATNIQAYHKLRPIPQDHIDRLSPKGELSQEQNEGYY